MKTINFINPAFLPHLLEIDVWMDETYTPLFTPDGWRVVQGMQDGFGEEDVPLCNLED